MTTKKMNTQVLIAELHMLSFYLKATSLRIKESKIFEQLSDLQTYLFFLNVSNLLNDERYSELFVNFDESEQNVVSQSVSLLTKWVAGITDKKSGYLFFKLNVVAMLDHISERLNERLDNLFRTETFPGQQEVPTPKPVKEATLADKVNVFIDMANKHKYLLMYNGDNLDNYLIRRVLNNDALKPALVEVNHIDKNGEPEDQVIYFVIATLVESYTKPPMFSDVLAKTNSVSAASLSESIAVVGGLMDASLIKQFISQLKKALYIEMPSADRNSLVWKKIRRVESIDDDPQNTFIHLTSFDPTDKQVEAYPLSGLDIPKLRLRSTPPVEESVLKQWCAALTSSMKNQPHQVGLIKRGTGRVLWINHVAGPEETGDCVLEVIDPNTLEPLSCKLSDIIISRWDTFQAK